MNLKITGQNYEKELSFTGFAMSKLQNLFLVITTRKKEQTILHHFAENILSSFFHLTIFNPSLYFGILKLM